MVDQLVMTRIQSWNHNIGRSVCSTPSAVKPPLIDSDKEYASKCLGDIMPGGRITRMLTIQAIAKPDYENEAPENIGPGVEPSPFVRFHVSGARNLTIASVQSAIYLKNAGSDHKPEIIAAEQHQTG